MAANDGELSPARGGARAAVAVPVARASGAGGGHAGDRLERHQHQHQHHQHQHQHHHHEDRVGWGGRASHGDRGDARYGRDGTPHARVGRDGRGRGRRSGGGGRGRGDDGARGGGRTGRGRGRGRGFGGLGGGGYEYGYDARFIKPRREPKVNYASKIKRCVHTGDVSVGFQWFSAACERYRREVAMGIFERAGGDPRTTCPMGIDETTYYKLIAALIKETHADHASEVSRAMAAFGLKMSTKRFTEIIASVPCRTRAKEALAFVDACCRGPDFSDEFPSTSAQGGILEFGDVATATYFTKNMRLLVMEFCEESSQIMDRIKKRSTKSLEQAGTCSLNLVAKPSKIKGGRLCLSTQMLADAPNSLPRMACLKSLEDGKRGVQVGDSVLVRRYQPAVAVEEDSSETEPESTPTEVAANSSLKASAAAFVPKPKAPKPLAAPETPMEEYEGVVEIVPYTLNELHVKLDHGDVQELYGDDWRIDRLANRITFTRQVESLYELLEPNDPTKKAVCNTNPVFRQILTAGFQRSMKELADDLAAAVGSLNIRADDASDPDGTTNGVTPKEHKFRVHEIPPWQPGCEMINLEAVPMLCQGIINPTGDLKAPGPYDRVVDNITRNHGLNASQRDAMKAALERRLTLIQGPPGTGKTHTSVAIVRGMLEIGHGPVLCTSDSNTAVDNMVEGLAKAGVNVIRLGRPEAVRPDLARYQIENAIPPGATKHEAYEAQLRAVRYAQAICATCSGAGSDFLDRINFSAVMLDEASQVTEPMSLVPLANGCQQLVLVGDHKQLPPTVVSREAELAGMTLSLFDRLTRAGVKPYLLDTQFRMHPAISHFPSHSFYNGLVKSGTPAKDRPAPKGFQWPIPSVPIAFCPTPENSKETNDNLSYSNRVEAERVLEILLGVLSAGELRPCHVGIVTPYAAQVKLIRSMLRQRGVRTGVDRDTGEAGIEVSSVDGYQGREKELMIVSTVRANDLNTIGFVADARRCNVTLTRARRGVIVVGHASTLSKDRRTWGPWVRWVRNAGLTLGVKGRREDIAAVKAIEADSQSGAPATRLVPAPRGLVPRGYR
ncbi:P-loop containing nucleoside triphosphate hydrolase [Ostreococcus tauri]|uniref:P-loop containing nucleoside triphosphate hydrolase n=1 Tax=Ostreococcus tauri TaxID=70448 RepID=A0A090MD74_OSTTA|nr:P-loop containing nucleoside triphosphate hydrolase [Ostreococcus tauri]CEG00009.1 P-loop containing nucleoside triphosphate hydrolase [Ostreococcus tauri]|eukprot:XP_003082487.2 P-loop containing nucleoside triphosphate hydrolase [Ostreococcus tauri]